MMELWYNIDGSSLYSVSAKDVFLCFLPFMEWLGHKSFQPAWYHMAVSGRARERTRAKAKILRFPQIMVRMRLTGKFRRVVICFHARAATILLFYAAGSGHFFYGEFLDVSAR